MASMVDLKEVLERVQNDKNLLLELIEDFQKDYAKKRTLIDAALREKKFDKIKETAHSLKGGAGNLSIHSMYDCFMLIELHLADAKEGGLIKDVLKDLDKQFKELQDFALNFKKRL